MDSTTVLSSVITSDMVSGVFDEIIGLLPVIIPACVGFLGIRKAWSFVMGCLRSA